MNFDANQTTEQGAVIVEANDIAEHHGRYGEYPCADSGEVRLMERITGSLGPR